MTKKKGIWILSGLAVLLILALLNGLRIYFNPESLLAKKGSYEYLPPDTSDKDPLLHISEDFMVTQEFETNLPIVILELDGELADYKTFLNLGQNVAATIAGKLDGKVGNNGVMEMVYEDTDPYITGTISVIDGGNHDNHLKDEVVASSRIRIKKRGHTSYTFDKPQYLIKTVDGELENPIDLLEMGEADSWILNGSMADKSMLRNYLSYRIASEAGGSALSPDCRYCEVLLVTENGYEYQGVYLLQEAVSRGKERVDIEQYKPKNSYTGYIVRRDRFTNFDVMLDTYGRLNSLAPEWIGVKYPSQARLTEASRQYIEADFSKIEQVIYSESEDTFKTYDKYIDIDSFVDYFLINEFFGNYDAGNHSTYMYKNSGDKLHMGPVWDFDQGMNNYFMDEMDPYTLAFQTKPFYDRLCKDVRFIDCLKERYSELRRDTLSEEHIQEVMDEITAYLQSARVREWYRWAADYEDGTFTNIHNYYLQPYEREGVVLNRFNDAYEKELYVIRNYLHKHGKAIGVELTKLYDLAECNSSIKNENELLLLVIMVLFLVPTLLINRKG